MVRTTYGTPQRAMAVAVRSGSSGSRGLGCRLVLTAQKRHARVQSAPMSMSVAVAVPSVPPPQHSPMFGHLASSHTVCSPTPRSCAFISATLAPVAIGVRSHCGSRPLPGRKSASIGPGASFVYLRMGAGAGGP